MTLNRTDLDCDRSEFRQEVLDFYREKRETMTVSVGIMETAYEASLKESGVSASDLPGNLSLGAWLGQIGEELQTGQEGPK